MRDYVHDGSFAVLILCYGHPEKNLSYEILKKHGYTGQIYFITSDDDKSVPQFREIYGEDRVKTFHKEDIQKHFDIMDNRNNNKCAVFARNYCFDVAEELGLETFMELDDDSVSFACRYLENNSLKRIPCMTLDDVFNAMIDFALCSNKIRAVALPQIGDFIGGKGSMYFKDGFVRKCMNTWICKTKDRFWFQGRMNDDVNTFAYNGMLGGVFLTIGNVALDQLPTQLPTTGMGDMYKKSGTYQKSFYTVMLCPSFARIKMMGDSHMRVHHTLEKEFDYPRIISDRYKC